LLGISGLLCWNAVLTSFDYYNARYPDYNPSFTFGIPQFVAQCIFGILSPAFAKKFKNEALITFGLAGVATGVIALLLVAMYMPTLGGFILCEIISFLLGGFSTIAAYCAVGIVS